MLMSGETIEKILVIQTGFLGDVVLSTPVFTQLRKLYPDSSIVLLTTPGAAPMLQGHSALDEVLSYDKRKSDSGIGGLFRMASRLRKYKFSKVVSLHKSHRTALLVAMLGAKKTIGFREASLSFLYSSCATRAEYQHEVQRNLAILKPLGVEPEQSSCPMSLPVLDEAAAQASELLAGAGKRAIAVAPGSVWATKRWTVEGFASVSDAFLRKGFSVVLIGGPDDVAAGEKIESMVSTRDGLINLIGRCSLPVSTAVVDRMDLVVSNDSAPLHIASATNTPVVALFCATVPEFGFGPWQVRSSVLGVENLSCRPCGRHGGMTCPTGTHACQKDLTAQQVIEAAEELLGGSRQQ